MTQFYISSKTIFPNGRFAILGHPRLNLYSKGSSLCRLNSLHFSYPVRFSNHFFARDVFSLCYNNASTLSLWSQFIGVKACRLTKNKNMPVQPNNLHWYIIQDIILCSSVALEEHLKSSDKFLNTWQKHSILICPLCYASTWYFKVIKCIRAAFFCIMKTFISRKRHPSPQSDKVDRN